MIRICNRSVHSSQENWAVEFPIYRPHILSNPFSHIEFGRIKCIDMYEEFLRQKLSEEEPRITSIMDDIVRCAMRGPVYLVCCCVPKRCHGEVIRKVALERIAEKRRAEATPMDIDVNQLSIDIAHCVDPEMALEMDPDLFGEYGEDRLSKFKSSIVEILADHGIIAKSTTQ